MEAYEEIKTIGKGSFGRAILVKRKEDGLELVLKQINVMEMCQRERDDSMNEVRVLSMLDDSAFARTVVGTPYYLSPEICEDLPYDHKSDIWSLGCVLYEMATLKHAFNATSLPALVLKILKGNYPPIPSMQSGCNSSIFSKTYHSNNQTYINIKHQQLDYVHLPQLHR
eukprot:gene4401-5150_t